MNTSIFYRAIEKWGDTAQKIMLIEEMSELTKEICKAFRGNNNRDELIDEISDVFIMLEQAKIVFNIKDKEIGDRIEYKLSRIEERLNR